MIPYTIHGPHTGMLYLVAVRDERFFLYPPASFVVQLDAVTLEPCGYVVMHPHEEREVTAPWPWWSRRRARRLVMKAERRVRRGMRSIYHAGPVR